MTQTDYYIDRKLKSARTFLGRWVGANVRLKELTSSHQTLTLELYFDDRDDCLRVACAGPARIRSPAFWRDSSLEVSGERTQDGVVFVVRDQRADMEIECEAIELAEYPRRY